MELDLPYKVEYCKSKADSCNKCKRKFGEGVLRIAEMVQVRSNLNQAEICKLCCCLLQVGLLIRVSFFSMYT